MVSGMRKLVKLFFPINYTGIHRTRLGSLDRLLGARPLLPDSFFSSLAGHLPASAFSVYTDILIRSTSTFLH